jgi:hypothetical protein
VHQGDVQRAQQARVLVPDLKDVVSGVQVVQPLAKVGQAVRRLGDLHPGLGGGQLMKANAQPLAGHRRRELERALPRGGGQLGELEQRQRRHLRGQRLGRDVDPRPQPARGADLLQCQVRLEELQLLLQGHPLLPEGRQGEPEHVAQPGQQLHRLGRGPRANESRGAPERVLDELRMELDAHRIELGPR